MYGAPSLPLLKIVAQLPKYMFIGIKYAVRLYNARRRRRSEVAVSPPHACLHLVFGGVGGYSQSALPERTALVAGAL